MNTFNNTMILSGWRCNNSLLENIEANDYLRRELDNMQILHHDAVGYYKESCQKYGNQEVSLVIHCKDDMDKEQVLGLAFITQDSVLDIDSNNEASLLFEDGSSEYLGEMLEVSEHEAKKADAYTYYLTRYYVAK